ADYGCPNRFSTDRLRLSALVICLLAMPACAEEVQFDRDIRPILSDNCFSCHGPDEHGREADLRLDVREDAVDYGAITPGDIDASLILERIGETDPDLVMPPPSTGKHIEPDQIRLLEQWIKSGAVYERHWSFVPVPPQVDAPRVDDPDGWARSELDSFVLHRLHKEGLEPAKQATPGEWLRRVSYDLTGLPPDLEMLERFLADPSDQAYEDVVEELLASDAYGEHMAAMWLDVARYADTFGYQNDVPMEVWPWRDWVIRSFNKNLPYDEFVHQQIAGDLLPNATVDQKLATTFNRLHRQTNEGGSVVEEFRQANIADRTVTAGTAFLGLTMDCCRCHDHKYDPILRKDFYSFAAYFSNIDELGLYSHFTFGVPTPALLLYQDDQEEQHRAAQAKVSQLENQLAKSWEKRLAKWNNDRLVPTVKQVAPPKPDFSFALEGEQEGVVGKSTRCNGDDEIVCQGVSEFSRFDPFTISLWVKPAISQPRMLVLHQSVAAEDSAFRGLQLTVDDGRPEISLIHFWPGNAVRIESSQAIPTDQWSLLSVRHDGSGRAAGLSIYVNGSPVTTTIERDQLTRDIRHRAEWNDRKVGQVKMALGARFRDIGFRDGLVDDLQVFQRMLSEAEILSIFNAAVRSSDDPEVAKWPPKSTTAQMQLEHDWLQTPDHLELSSQLRQARAEEDRIITGVRAIMTMRTANKPRKTHMLQRGDYTMPGDEVTPATPQFLFQEKLNGQDRLGQDQLRQDRLGLARWLTHADNPLVSRVIVNRFWHHFFGRGIVASLEDFGSQGQSPTHPQLLDYLARSLMRDHWDLKNLCRRIVLSSTYRQSSIPSDRRLFESDPQNKLLARGPKHRLSAEQVRDTVLAVSGLLVRKVGGPSVMPYQPKGLWKESGTGKEYKQSTGEGLYRRSLYTFWKRTAPPPSMLTFDATSRESCTAKRELTTTPLQALVLLNDPQYVEAARVLAEKLVQKHSSLDDRWTELFLRLICRPPTEQEREIINLLYGEQLESFRQDVSAAKRFISVGESKVNQTLDPAELAAVAVVVETLFSYDETQMKR
ncbi:MAG: DUF1553 domain-containing protein, partial [Pirellulales bacterium]|nr:DUF1553 domain-containing protein [Pirellulales bacterium]